MYLRAIWVWVFLLSLLIQNSFTYSQTAGLATDPSVLKTLQGRNFEPGGKFFPPLLVRGRVIDSTRQGNLRLNAGPTILVTPTLAIQTGTVKGNVNYIIDLAGHHGHEVHGPFSSSSTRSVTVSEGNEQRSVKFDLNVSGTLTHPANGYDGPRGGGYPSPSRFGAIDIYSIDVSGSVEGQFMVDPSDVRSDRSPGARSGLPNSNENNPGFPNGGSSRPGDSFPSADAQPPLYDPNSGGYSAPELSGNEGFDGLLPGGSDPRFENDLGGLVFDTEPEVTLTEAERLELIEIGVDIVGIADPTGLADLTGVGINLYQKDWTDALISTAGLLPYVGDLAKTFKISGYSKSLAKFAQKAIDNPAFAKLIKPYVSAIDVGLDKILSSQKILDHLPDSIVNTIRGLKRQTNKILKAKTDPFRRVPKNLAEKLALDEAKAGAGKKIIDNLGDPKFKGMEKWQHSRVNADGSKTVIHYVRDPKTGKTMDFKFK